MDEESKEPLEGRLSDEAREYLERADALAEQLVRSEGAERVAAAERLIEEAPPVGAATERPATAQSHPLGADARAADAQVSTTDEPVEWPAALTEDEARQILREYGAQRSLPDEMFDVPITLTDHTCWRFLLVRLLEDREEEWVLDNGSTDPPALTYDVGIENLSVGEPVALEEARWAMERAGSRQRERCRQCAGRGEGPCSTCHGRGEEPCLRCGRRGWIGDSRTGGQKRCWFCQGRGGIPCTACGSSGFWTCATCRGSGEVELYLLGTISRTREEKHAESGRPSAFGLPSSYKMPVVWRGSGEVVPDGLPEDVARAAETLVASAREREVLRRLDLARVQITEAVFTVEGRGTQRAYLVQGADGPTVHGLHKLKPPRTGRAGFLRARWGRLVGGLVALLVVGGAILAAVLVTSSVGESAGEPAASGTSNQSAQPSWEPCGDGPPDSFVDSILALRTSCRTAVAVAGSYGQAASRSYVAEVAGFSCVRASDIAFDVTCDGPGGAKIRFSGG